MARVYYTDLRYTVANSSIHLAYKAIYIPLYAKCKGTNNTALRRYQ